MAGRYDWEKWRRLYVSGDESITLESLSLLPNAPNLATLKRRCSQESWTQQRKEFRYHAAAKTQDAIAKVDQIVDMAEIIARHSRTAKSFHAVAMKALNYYIQNPDELKALNPNTIIALAKFGMEMERLTAGMATQHIEVDAAMKLDEMSDRQLEMIASGEDADKVLQLN